MAKLTDFGREVKIRLITIEKTQAWLINEVRERTGLFFDDSYMRKLLIGERAAPKLVKAICEILDMDVPDNGDSNER